MKNISCIGGEIGGALLIRGAKNMVVVKQLNAHMMKVGVDYAIC